MAEPNIVGVSDLKGKSVGLAVTTSAADILSSVATGHVLKVNSLTVCNIDGTNACWVTVDHYRSATARRIVYQMTVPPGVTLSVMAKPLYLQEGDALRLTAQNNSDLEAVASYEDITDA